MSRRQQNDARTDAEEAARVRLDKWLWAARFFKTRALAAAAVESGKIEINGETPKRARAVRVGDTVRIRLGPFEHHVVVQTLSERRGSATVAATLYEETAESRRARELRAWQLKNAAPHFDYEKGRPTKRDRREIDRLKGR